MNHTLEDWANTLLTDYSNTNLLIFSDWLELDQDDEELAQAARGVRELLVRQRKRPSRDFREFLQMWTWFQGLGGHDDLPSPVFDALQAGRMAGVRTWRDYQVTPACSNALAHLTALLDAAQAWARCNPEPLTKGKVNA